MEGTKKNFGYGGGKKLTLWRGQKNKQLLKSYDYTLFESENLIMSHSVYFDVKNNLKNKTTNTQTLSLSIYLPCL